MQPGPTGDYIKSTLHGDVHGAKNLACGLTIGPWGPCLLLGLILRQIEVISHVPLVCSKVLSDKNLAYSHQLGMVQRCFGQKEVFFKFHSTGPKTADSCQKVKITFWILWHAATPFFSKIPSLWPGMKYFLQHMSFSEGCYAPFWRTVNKRDFSELAPLEVNRLEKPGSNISWLDFCGPLGIEKDFWSHLGF